MCPSDQRLTGDMMTYRGRGHKSKWACSATPAPEYNKAARQRHRASAWQQHSKTMATTRQQSHRPGNSVGQQHYCNTVKLKQEQTGPHLKKQLLQDKNTPGKNRIEHHSATTYTQARRIFKMFFSKVMNNSADEAR